MMIFLISACTKILQPYQFAVHHNLTVVKSARSGKTAYAPSRLANLLLISKLDSMFRNLQRVNQLDHIQLSVASYESSNISVFLTFAVIGDKQQGFYRLRLFQMQKIGYFFYCLGSRRIDFLFRKHFYIGLRRRVYTFRSLRSSRHIASCAICDFTLTNFGKRSEFVRIAAPNGACISFNRPEGQSASGKNPVVCVIHRLIAFIQALIILIERISVLHDEFSASHQSKTRSGFISVLGLNLIQIHRQLPVRGYIVSNNVGKNFLMCWSQTKISAVSVFQSPELRSVCVPSSGLLPKFGRLYSRHVNFLRACCVHLLSDDILNLADRAPAKRHKTIYP